MKKTTILYLFLLYFPFSFSQTVNLFHLSADTLLKSENSENPGIDISNNWKFHQGDNIHWKNGDYNDSNWRIINTFFSKDSLTKEEQNGICWIRLKIKVDSASRNKIYALMISQRGASEIYLDGNFIDRFGHVDKMASEEIPYDPHNTPISIYLDNEATHLIAIRYSYSNLLMNQKRFGEIFTNWGLRISVGINNYDIKTLSAKERINSSIYFSLFGVLFALALLHFFIYIYYRNRKENFHYSLFTFSFATFFITLFFQLYLSNPVVSIISGILSIYMIVLTFLFFISFIHTINYKKLPKIFYLFLVYAIFILSFPIVINFISTKVINIIISIYFGLVCIEGIRMIIRAIVKRKEGIWIIGVGSLIFVGIILFDLLLPLLNLTYLSTSIIFGIISYTCMISLPISMSIYIAKSFAKTNKDLSIKINEVQELSEQAIENEKKSAEVRLQREQEKAKLRETELLAKALESENARKSQELEEAHKLQLSMLPNSIPKLNNFDISFYMKTATEVGGDYYDFNIGIDGTLTIALGDATGHGLKAGTMVVATKSLFNSYADEEDIVSVLQTCNRAIKRMNLSKLYMCLTLIKIRDNCLRLTAAGMPPVLVYREASKTVEEIVIKAMPLGAFHNFPYHSEEIILRKGDTILMMSDGYPELQNNQRDLLGYEKVIEIFKKSGLKSSGEIITDLNEYGEIWAEGAELKDDVTFVVVKVLEESENKSFV